MIVGGVAASLRGGSRVTFDLDVVPSLEPASWQAAVDLLWSLGARPRIPEPLERIRDVEHVRRWRQEKGMLALNFRAPDARRTCWTSPSSGPSRSGRPARPEGGCPLAGAGASAPGVCQMTA